MKAQDVLTKLIEIITLNLNELATCGLKNLFVYGEKTAYVECLEILQSWEGATMHNLDYNIQEKYLKY